MRFLNKILIITPLLSCLALNITPAIADNSDCGIFGILPYHHEGPTNNGFDIVKNSRETTIGPANFLTTDQQKAIITNNDLNTAIINLKKYCCENQIGRLDRNTCKKDKVFFNDNTPDSPYLFDHLFDVIMRRLNGMNGEYDIYTKTNMTLDKKGEERRNRINEKAESQKGSTPQIIYTKYKEMWNQTPEYNIATLIYPKFGENDHDFLEYVGGKKDIKESPEIAKALKEYDKRTIYDRYSNACALTEFFYALLNAGQNSKDKKETISRLAKGKNGLVCDDIIKNQINGENNYVKIIIKNSSNLFLTNYLEGYISYMYNRQQTLQKLRKDSSDRFGDVVNAIPCLQKKCTK